MHSLSGILITLGIAFGLATVADAAPRLPDHSPRNAFDPLGEASGVPLGLEPPPDWSPPIVPGSPSQTGHRGPQHAETRKGPVSVPPASGFPWGTLLPGICVDQDHHVRFTVPEPASLVVWLIFGLGVGAARLRRRRQVWHAWWERWEE